jgi:hypothetical protein
MHPSVSVFWRSTALPAFALCMSGACLCFCLAYNLPRLCTQQGCGCDQVVGLGHQRFCAFRNPACLFHRHSLRHFAISPIPPTFFTFQCLIELVCKFSQLGWIHFFTDLLSKITPITRLRGHVKLLSMFRLFSSYSGLNCESEHNCTTLFFSAQTPTKLQWCSSPTRILDRLRQKTCPECFAWFH